jgi:hypothetical protein
MKANKKKYRNEEWSGVFGDNKCYKYFLDERFGIGFMTLTNESWCDPEIDPLETLPLLLIYPRVSDTYLEDFLCNKDEIKIILN